MSWIHALLLIPALLALAGCSRGSHDARSLVLITIDTLRADYVGAYGGPVDTPAMDSLAVEGVLVENAFTPTPTTAPAHASLMTGVYAWRHGVRDNAVPLSSDLSTLAELMRKQGLTTAAFVSSGVLHPRFGFDQGFDRYEFVPGNRRDGSPRSVANAEQTTSRVLDWLAGHRQSSKRFFLWVHYLDPHMPYEPPASHALATTKPVDLSGKKLPPRVDSLDELRDLIRSYGGEVRYTDAQVMRLLSALRKWGMWYESAVILTSDHGEGLGDHGVLEHGVNLFDELVRIPLLVVAPGLPSGRRFQGLVQLEDLLPTSLALVGAPIPSGLDGFNLVPWLRGEATSSPRTQAIGQRKRYPGATDLFFVRRSDEKWIGAARGRGLLFDMRTDPGELAGRPSQPQPDVGKALDGLSTAAEAQQDLDADTRRFLRTLGYLETESELLEPGEEPSTPDQ